MFRARFMERSPGRFRVNANRRPDVLYPKESGLAFERAMKGLGLQIYAAVETGRLPEPFNRFMLRAACPGWAENTYRQFLAKHEIGNCQGNPQLFRRLDRGWYRTLRSLRAALE